MYLAHWGLREPPFRNSVDPRQFFRSPTHDEALARLHFLSEGHRRAGLLLGPAGSGKSMVFAVLHSAARDAGQAVARVSLASLGKHELLDALCAAWGLNPDLGTAEHDVWRLLFDRIAEFHVERRAVLLMADHADEAEDEVLRQVQRLAQADIGQKPAATIVLAARAEHVTRIGFRLLELADLRIDLAPWGEFEVRQFIEQALLRAGCDEMVFTAGAVTRLTHLTGGIPRHVAQMAELALVATAGMTLPRIDESTIDSVFAELGVVYQLVDAA